MSWMNDKELGPGAELDRLVLDHVMGGEAPEGRGQFSTAGPANKAMIDRLGEQGFEYRLQNKGHRPPWVAWFGRDGKAWEATSRTQFAANCLAALKAADYLDSLLGQGRDYSLDVT